MGEMKIDRLTRHKLTVAEYHQLGDAGVLTEADRIELIEGELIDMAPIGSRHASVVNRLCNLLSQAAQGAAIVSAQNPIFLPPDSEPQPDLALLKPRPDFYASGHPGPADVLLIIEVMGTSQWYDREVKLPLYARHGIPEVWLVDLEARRVEVNLRPSEGAYQESAPADLTGRLAPTALPALEVDLAGLF